MTADEAMKAARELWPDMPFGVLVGMDGDRPFVGYATKDRKMVRFAAGSFEVALERAALWTGLPENDWRLQAHKEGDGAPSRKEG